MDTPLFSVRVSQNSPESSLDRKRYQVADCGAKAVVHPSMLAAAEIVHRLLDGRLMGIVREPPGR
jgi:hypothetical protein